MAEKKSVFFTGLDNMKSATSGGFVSLKHGDTMIIRFLDDVDGENALAQYYEHYVEIGDMRESVPCVEGIYGECPLDGVGVKKTYRVLINVVDCATGKVLILKKGREFVNDCITPYVKEYGTLTDRYYKLRGEEKTRGGITYVGLSMIPVDKIPDDYPSIDFDKLQRTDWELFLTLPKKEYIEKLAADFVAGNRKD